MQFAQTFAHVLGILIAAVITVISGYGLFLDFRDRHHWSSKTYKRDDTYTIAACIVSIAVGLTSMSLWAGTLGSAYDPRGLWAFDAGIIILLLGLAIMVRKNQPNYQTAIMVCACLGGPLLAVMLGWQLALALSIVTTVTFFGHLGIGEITMMRSRAAYRRQRAATRN